jgi:hypothetical protein
MFNDDPEKEVLPASAQQFAERIGEQNHRVKIYDTPKGLCMSCHSSLVFRSPKLKNAEWQILCLAAMGHTREMPDDVSYCNQYSQRGAQSLCDMKKTATLIEKEDARRVGFNSDE